MSPLTTSPLLADLHRRVAARLDETGVRYTRGRRAVVAALATAGGPLSTAELHAGPAAGVPLSSLYRTLTVLGDAGVIHRVHDTAGLARYELAEWLLGHHHHFVCDECGAASDFDVDAGLEAELEALAARMGAAAGFEVAGHRLDLEGRCEMCRAG